VEDAEKMVRDADAVLVGSAELVAVTVTAAGEGTPEGAVYSPLLPIDPQAAALQPAPCTDHVTAVFDVPTTDAVNCCVAPVATEALLGVKLTLTTDTIVTLADADLLGTAMLVATILTFGGEGATAGA